MTEPDPIAAILAYHRLSKHRPEAYAPGPGHLDWANQPDPFRRFAGCPRLPLALGADRLETGFDALFRPGASRPAAGAEPGAGSLEKPRCQPLGLAL